MNSEVLLQMRKLLEPFFTYRANVVALSYKTKIDNTGVDVFEFF